MRWISSDVQLALPLARQRAIVVIAVTLSDLLIEGVGHSGVAVFFSQSRAPIQRGTNFV